MKLIHLSDLHLGIRVNEFNMYEDQVHILREILRITDEEKPDAVLIAGDIYDKAVPSAEAVALFDNFLVSLAKRRLQVFVISGNHDSPERLAFGGRLMEESGIHISPVYNGQVTPISMTDEFGTVNIFMLPFLKPVHVRRFFDTPIESYTDAIGAVISRMERDPSQRSILISHQCVTNTLPEISDKINIGGIDNVHAAVYEGFDYVALGHIHSAHNIGGNPVRFCGTPLKYSFSEAGDEKSVTVVELREKGNLTLRTVPLKPLHDMQEIRGTYQALMQKQFYENTSYPTDYMHITLTDEEDIPDAVNRLRTVYHNLMKLDYDNQRTRSHGIIDSGADADSKSPLELFAEFYELQNNQPMSAEQYEFMNSLIEQVWEGQV